MPGYGRKNSASIGVSMKVLLVDDSPDLLEATARLLRREGFIVVTAGDGMQAMKAWQEEQPDLVLLDIGLPRMSGFDVCRAIRRSSEVPIIMLSGLHDEENVVQGFQLGADDYVTKPFSARQLAMRIRAVTRRAKMAATKPPVSPEIKVANLVLNQETREVRRGDLTIRLTRLEFRILFLLASNPGRVVSTSRILEYALGYQSNDSSSLKTHFSRIRRKLQVPPESPGYILAVNSVGYRLLV
jgi:DNA-binding response OmpR family regulator